METDKVKKCVVRKIIFCTGLIRAAKAEQISTVPAQHDKPKKSNKEGPLSNALQKSPFASVLARKNTEGRPPADC
jgi:hypothetical protein